MKISDELIESFKKTNRWIGITGGRFTNHNLEQAISIFQRIRDNELPILYIAKSNSAYIVNAQEYQVLKKKDILMTFEDNFFPICPNCGIDLEGGHDLPARVMKYCFMCGQRIGEKE